MIHNMKPKNKVQKTTSCGTLTSRVNPTVPGRLQVLLIKQFAHKDSWGIPKGHIHADETLEECAVRETREETGLGVVVGRRLPDIRIELKNESKTLVTFAASPVDPLQEPIHDDPDCEVADARWFDVDDIVSDAVNAPRLQAYQAEHITTFLTKLVRGDHDRDVNEGHTGP